MKLFMQDVSGFVQRGSLLNTHVLLVLCCVVFVFNDPPTAKVIWKLDHSLNSNLTDWRSWGSNLRPLVYKASTLSTPSCTCIIENKVIA